MSAQLLVRARQHQPDNRPAAPGAVGAGEPIDSFLGPSSERFFGAGYRRVTQEIVTLAWESGPGLSSGRALAGHASVACAADWSRKLGVDAVPHLSSIDAVALSLRLVDAFLMNGVRLGTGGASRVWLRRFAMKAGAAPYYDLDQVGLHLVDRGSFPSQVLPGGWHTQFDCTVGNIRVRCEVEHDVALERHTDPGAVVVPAAPSHAVGYRNRVHDIADVAVDVEAQWARAAVCTTDEAPMVPRPGEQGSVYEPSVSLIDQMIVLAQVGQALVYRIDDLDRARTNTLWMRRIDMWRDSPLEALDHVRPCNTFVKRASVVDFSGSRWRALNLAGACGDTTVQYSVAHELQDDGGEP